MKGKGRGSIPNRRPSQHDLDRMKMSLGERQIQARGEKDQKKYPDKKKNS